MLGACVAPGPELRAHPPDGKHPAGWVEARGLPAAELAGLGTDALAVRVDAPEGARVPPVPPVLGASRREGGALVFEPRFPFQPGRAYRATLTRAGGGDLALTFSFPRVERSSTTRVTAVHPLGPLLPANVLRFYLHFSAPMTRGQAYRHARVVDSTGAPVESAFLRVEPELWDPDTTRLTLLVEPGRIKRGLGPREELGPVFEPGGEYAIEVDPAWRDGRGAPLASGFRHGFRIGAEDHVSPDPHRWTVEVPAAGTLDPLLVRTAEVLDRALLERLVTVEGAHGASIPGLARAAEDGRKWSFTPDEPWTAGSYALVVDPVLEDLAGNSVGRPFEVALASGSDATVMSPVRVGFEVGTGER